MYWSEVFHPVGGEWIGYRGWVEVTVILARCKFHFIREHENLIQVIILIEEWDG